MAKADQSLTRELDALFESASTDLLVDAGLVGDEQLAYFSRLMIRARDALGNEWNRVTKIAMLHHDLNQILASGART